VPANAPAARWKVVIPRMSRSATASDPTSRGGSSCVPQESARRRGSEPNRSPVLPKSEEPKDEQDDNDGANDVDDLIHGFLSSVWMGQTMERPTLMVRVLRYTRPDAVSVRCRTEGPGTTDAWRGPRAGPEGWRGSQGRAGRAPFQKDDLQASGLMISTRRRCERPEAVMGLALPAGYVG